MARSEHPAAKPLPRGVIGLRRLLHRIATIALLGIALGLVMQALILAGRMLAGAPFPGPEILASVAQGVTWSLVVCLGVGIGTTALRVPVPVVGLIGLITAPLALILAISAQRGINLLLDTPESGFTLALLVIACIKALEYGFLGYMLARWIHLGREQLRPYLLLGFATGITFGGAIVAAAWQLAGTPLVLPAVVGLTINELLFPVGCALVIFAIRWWP